MSVISVYIGVLILALIIGNGLLSLTKGHGVPRRQAIRQARQRPMPVESQPEPSSTSMPAPATDASSTLNFESRLKALDELTRMAHGRIEELEDYLKKPTVVVKSSGKTEELAENIESFISENNNHAEELNGLAEDVTAFKDESTKSIQDLKTQSAQLFQDMSEKIRTLDHFKANTKIELQGVREVADNMQMALKEASEVKTEDDKQDLLLELDEIQSRLERLHAFKTNTEVELKALKELVLLLKDMFDKPKESAEVWVKGNGKARNFEQDLAKFRRVSVNMKRMA
jgi:uncharacterized coiled-coil DUF342 family protein